jgi:hypothetical protein
VVLAQGRMLALVVDQAQPLCWAFFRAVWAKLGSTRWWWERRRALFYGYHLASRRALLEARLYGDERHRPLVLTETS